MDQASFHHPREARPLLLLLLLLIIIILSREAKNLGKEDHLHRRAHRLGDE